MGSDPSALVEVVRETFGALQDVDFPEVWGPRIVLRAQTAHGVIFAKAAGDADVRAEQVAIRLADEAGVPVPGILTGAANRRVPGGHWFAMTAVPGIEWVADDHALAECTLPDIARCLARLHCVRRAGFGALDHFGNGTVGSWPEWIIQTVRGYLDRLVDSHDAPDAFRTMTLRVFERFTPDIQRGSLVHGDLTGCETFVDPSDGRVTGIVDWGGAIIGDPIYEFAKLQAGGPADDPTPRQVLPTILKKYRAETGTDRDDLERVLPLYQAHNALFNADWCRREGVPWIDGLLDAAGMWLRAVDGRAS